MCLCISPLFRQPDTDLKEGQKVSFELETGRSIRYHNDLKIAE